MSAPSAYLHIVDAICYRNVEGLNKTLLKHSFVNTIKWEVDPFTIQRYDFIIDFVPFI